MTMGPANHSDDEAITGINVTPLVDITLVLLVVFMVTARLMVSQQIPADLPKAASSEQQQVVLTVTVTESGTMLVDGRPVDDATLRSTAAEALSKTPDLRTVVQAPSSATHGTVIHVVDELREAGITRIGFAVERKAS
jgi:biopolymer transport protein ExbD